jgi:hypothetical protein
MPITAPVSLAVIGREPGLYGSAFRDDVGDEQERERQQEQPRNPISQALAPPESNAVVPQHGCGHVLGLGSIRITQSWCGRRV